MKPYSSKNAASLCYLLFALARWTI